MNDIRLRVLAAAFFSGIAFTAQAADETVLASVGERKITAEDLRGFELLGAKALSADLTETQRDSALLRALIDKTVMLAEARHRNIQDEDWFKRRLQERVNAHVVNLYTTARISAPVSIAEEELEERFRATHRDRALRFAGILVETEEEAREILQLADEGADFAELARKHSLFEKTRDQGGDTGLYMLRDETNPPIQPIFRLEVGSLSEPLPFPFKGKQHFGVFKILDSISVGIEAVVDEVKEEIFIRKRAERERVVLDSLREHYAPEIQTKNIAAASERFLREGLTDEVKALPVCTYRGGEIRIDDFQSVVSRSKDGVTNLSNPSWIEGMLNARVIPFALYLEAAKTLGLDTEESTLQWLENEKQNMLVSTLKRREVDDRIPETTFQEAEGFYRDHPGKFLTWETIKVTEIMVDDRQRAEELRRELDAGGDAGELARQHTTRAGLDHHDGLITLNKGTQFHYGAPLFEGARQLGVGEIGGPVELEDGWSVFKVVERTPSQVKPFNETSQKRARAYVKLDRYQRSFAEFVELLRERHKVQVFAD